MKTKSLEASFHGELDVLGVLARVEVVDRHRDRVDEELAEVPVDVADGVAIVEL